MSAAAAWAGIVVADVAASVDWYVANLGGSIAESDGSWAKVELPNRSCLELFAGDRTQVGRTFPSYGSDHGPPVLPGYAVEDPALLVEEQDLEVARSLPDWIVVAGHDRLRVVLMAEFPQSGRGLIGFRFATDGPEAPQRAFLDSLGVGDPLEVGDEVAVIPVFHAKRDAQVTDPDGTVVQLCC